MLQAQSLLFQLPAPAPPLPRDNSYRGIYLICLVLSKWNFDEI